MKKDLPWLPWPILISLLLAFALTIIPLPSPLAPMRPDWVLLVLVYWSMAFPRRVGVLTAALAGLFLDVLHHQLLGQNALGLALVIYLVLQIYPRLRVYPVWQQAFVVAFLVGLYRVLQVWIYGATGFPPDTALYWSPILSSSLLWPLVYHVLRDARRRWLLHLT